MIHLIENKFRFKSDEQVSGIIEKERKLSKYFECKKTGNNNSTRCKEMFKGTQEKQLFSYTTYLFVGVYKRRRVSCKLR